MRSQWAWPLLLRRPRVHLKWDGRCWGRTVAWWLLIISYRLYVWAFVSSKRVSLVRFQSFIFQVLQTNIQMNILLLLLFLSWLGCLGTSTENYCNFEGVFHIFMGKSNTKFHKLEFMYVVVSTHYDEHKSEKTVNFGFKGTFSPKISYSTRITSQRLIVLEIHNFGSTFIFFTDLFYFLAKEIERFQEIAFQLFC